LTTAQDHKASRQFEKDKKRLKKQRRTVCVSCVLPREPTDETDNIFRAKKSRETERGNTSACTLCWAGFIRRF